MISQSKNVQWYKNIHFNRVFSHFCFSYSWASDVFETFEGWLNGLGKINVLNKNSPFLIIKFGYRKSSSVSSLRCLKQDICLSNGDSPLLSPFITLSERGRLCEEAKWCHAQLDWGARELVAMCICEWNTGWKFEFLNYRFSYFHFSQIFVKVKYQFVNWLNYLFYFFFNFMRCLNLRPLDRKPST